MSNVNLVDPKNIYIKTDSVKYGWPYRVCKTLPLSKQGNATPSDHAVGLNISLAYYVVVRVLKQ